MDEPIGLRQPYFRHDGRRAHVTRALRDQPTVRRGSSRIGSPSARRVDVLAPDGPARFAASRTASTSVVRRAIVSSVIASTRASHRVSSTIAPANTTTVSGDFLIACGIGTATVEFTRQSRRIVVNVLQVLQANTAVLAKSLRSRIRCYRRTRGLHQLDIATGRCRYCQREYPEVAPTQPADKSARPAPTRTGSVLSRLAARLRRMMGSLQAEPLARGQQRH